MPLKTLIRSSANQGFLLGPAPAKFFFLTTSDSYAGHPARKKNIFPSVLLLSLATLKLLKRTC